MKLIDSTTKSGLVKLKRNKSKVVIGAPHHAIGGVEKLPCPEHEVSDENTGYLARKLANYIESSYIIGCNATIDYNKSKENNYYKFIELITPKLLVEIHGHGGKKIGGNNIEISCGRKDNTEFSIKFSKLLNTKLRVKKDFEDIKVEGDLDKIYYKASKTISIQNKNWNSLHIELPPKLRVDTYNENGLPAFHEEFIHLLGDCIKEILE